MQGYSNWTCQHGNHYAVTKPWTYPPCNWTGQVLHIPAHAHFCADTMLCRSHGWRIRFSCCFELVTRCPMQYLTPREPEKALQLNVHAPEGSRDISQWFNQLWGHLLEHMLGPLPGAIQV